MREILFRGKRISDGAWVYGYYVRAFNGTDYILQSMDCIHVADTVYHTTVGSYTGLKDADNNKIFEGDILRLHDTRYFLVGFENGEYVLVGSKIPIRHISKMFHLAGNNIDNVDLFWR